MAFLKRYVRWFKTAFLLLTALLALLNIYQLVFKSHAVLEDSMDFRIYYVATKLYLKKQVFYDDSLIKQEWRQLVKAENIVAHSEPGYPNSVVVYPPGFVPLYLPFSLMHWSTARTAYLLTAVCLLIVSAYLLHKLQKRYGLSFTGIVLLVFAFKGTRYALITGQPMLLCLGLIITALYLYSKNKRSWTGLLLGLASFKFSFLLPVAFWFLMQKEWRVVAIAFIASVCLNMLIWSHYHFSPQLINAFTSHINTLWQFAHTHAEVNSLNTNTTELSTMLKYWFDLDLLKLKNFSFLLYCSSYVLAAWLMVKQKAPAYFILALLYLGDFCFGHHLVYDCLALLLLLPCLWYMPLKRRLVLALFLMPLLLPLNQCFQSLGYTGLMTITPVFVFALYLYWLWFTVSFHKQPHHAPRS